MLVFSPNKWNAPSRRQGSPYDDAARVHHASRAARRLRGRYWTRSGQTGQVRDKYRPGKAICNVRWGRSGTIGVPNEPTLPGAFDPSPTGVSRAGVLIVTVATAVLANS